MAWLDEYDSTGTDIWDTYTGPNEEYYVSPESTESGVYDSYELKKFAERVADNTATSEEAKGIFDRLTGTAKDLFKQYIYNPTTGAINSAGIATGMAGIYGLMGGNQVQTGGYNKPIPKLTATRAQVPYAADPNRRPGEAGRSYFTNTQYTAPTDAPAAQAAANTAAQGIAAAVPPRAAQVNPYEGKFTAAWNPDVKAMAAGGLAAGGFVVPADVIGHFGNGSTEAGLEVAEKYLGAEPIKGAGDGMSDSIPTHIDGKEKALVADGEAYIRPEMVAKLGGAEKLYAMMDKIRKARTGTTEQGKQIDPKKFMPGGIAQLAGGGTIHRFNLGGTAPTTATPPLSTPAATPLGTSTSSSLSPWAGDYVTNYLGKGQALAEAPYQTYGGPLTAGASNLQQQAFAGAGALAQAGYTPKNFENQYSTPGVGTATQFTNQYQAPAGLTGSPTQFTNQFQMPQAYNAAEFTAGKFGNQEAQQYMNPYLQSSLNPQLEAMRREADIQRVARAGKMAQAGAFGSSRQAVEDALGTESLQRQQAQTIGTGYNTAYQQGMAQFNADQARQLQAQQGTEQSRQYGASQGLSAAQAAAQYGQSAQTAQEQARQFGLGQLLSSAQTGAQYGQSAQAAQEQARQFGVGQQASQAQLAAQYGQAAAEATEASRRASSEFGLKSLGEAASLGAVQRGIEGEGIAADKAQFEEQRDRPYKMVQYQKDLLQGLPITSAATTANTTGVSQLTGGIADLMSLYKSLAGLGQAPAATTPAATTAS